jgi:hypothetical protein
MGAAASACAQYGGGVVRMDDGAVTFKGGSIANSTAGVRAPSACCIGARCVLHRRGRGARADCNGRGCAGLCAANRRRGAHGRWGRHVQGRLDREQHGGACAQRESRVRAPWYGMLRGAARPMDGAHGAAHACCGEWCTVYGAWSRSGACEYSFRIVGEGATPSGRRVLHTARALHDAPALVTHRVARVRNRKDACIEGGPVPPRCMRYRMRRCGMRYARCTGLRCVLHRRALHVASARVASCIGARCIGSRCIGARCIGALHRLVLPRPRLHRRRAAVPQRRCRVMRCSVCSVCAARSGEGRAVAVAERRRDALVRSPTAACSS